MKREIFTYLGNEITFRDENGNLMVNATQMAIPFSAKPSDWLRTAQSVRMAEAIAASHNCTPPDLFIINNGGNDSGTWMHEDIALVFAQWLSPAFYIWCNDRIKELLTKGSVSLPDFNNPAIAARAWADQYEKRELAEGKVKELAPKAESYERFLDSSKLMTVADVAKTLHFENAGPIQLYEILRKHEILSSQ